MTQALEQLYWSRELQRCERDPEYLAAQHLRIKGKGEIGLLPFKFNRPQRYLYARCMDQLKRTGRIRQIWGKARQIGASALARELCFQQAAFRNNRNALLVAHDEPSSLALFETYDRSFYTALPDPLKPARRHDARALMRFDKRKSQIVAGHSLNLNVGASQMQHILHLTEAARYRNAAEVQASLFPSLSRATGDDYSIGIIESTSIYGGTWFKQFADAAIAGDNGWEFSFVPWYWHDEYRMAKPRGWTLTAQERDWLRQFPEIIEENLVWYRAARAEYIANPAAVFQELAFDWPSSWLIPEGMERVFNADDLEAVSDLRRGALMRPTSMGLVEEMGQHSVQVWELPQPGTFYDLGIDPAGGRTRDADWTVAEVIRRDTLEQVAEWRVHMDPASEAFLDTVYWLGMNYNVAQINPDITGGWGAALLSELQRRSYPAIWLHRHRDDAKERVSNRLGFVYTKRDKPYLVNNAILLVARRKPLLHSETLLDELTMFLNLAPNEWGAPVGFKDDTANAWFLALLSARDEWRERWNPEEAMEQAAKQAVALPTRHKLHDVEGDLEPVGAEPIRLTPWRVK